MRMAMNVLDVTQRYVDDVRMSERTHKYIHTGDNMTVIIYGVRMSERTHTRVCISVIHTA